MARAGSQTQFVQAAEDLLSYAHLDVEPREIERVAEEVGRQVEQWLSDQQEQLIHSGPSEAMQLEPDTKFYIWRMVSAITTPLFKPIFPTLSTSSIYFMLTNI